MYKNLEAEMTRYEIKQKDIAEHLNLQLGTVSLKLNGKSIITLEEAQKIKQMFKDKGCELSIEYLFEN